MTDHMTQADIDAIRARCEAATEKWSVVKNAQTLVCGEKDGKLLIMADCIFKPDSAFIAHARTDIPALLAEVERMTAERDAALRRAEAAVADLREHASFAATCRLFAKGCGHDCQSPRCPGWQWRGPAPSSQTIGGEMVRKMLDEIGPEPGGEGGAK